MDKLKGCPFCGHRIAKKSGLYGISFYHCSACGAIVSFNPKEVDPAVCPEDIRFDDFLFNQRVNEKQEPMEVKEIHVDEYFCPACGSENTCDQGIVGDKFCSNCGQALYVNQN